MSVVWKFPVDIPGPTGRSLVDMPDEAQPLSVGIQDAQLYVWALVDPDGQIAARRLIVVNTGPEIVGLPDGARFLGTVTTIGGTVWHVWDGDAEVAA